jgi:hypothetical protein
VTAYVGLGGGEPPAQIQNSYESDIGLPFLLSPSAAVAANGSYKDGLCEIPGCTGSGGVGGGGVNE